MTATVTDPRHWNIGLVGYGEVGRILAEDLRKQDVKVAAYDIKLRRDQTGSALRAPTSSCWARSSTTSARGALVTTRK